MLDFHVEQSVIYHQKRGRMNGTTLGRSNITKEKIAMMENLVRYNNAHPYSQNRSSSQKENMDMLMQNFGVRIHRKEKAPQAYFVFGLIVGAIVTLAITTFVSLLINISTPKDDIIVPKKMATESSDKFSFIPPDSTTTKTTAAAVNSNKEYTVKSGDTLESIVIRFYGSFDLSKVNAIQAANKMANPNALSIGQRLIIPMN